MFKYLTRVVFFIGAHTEEDKLQVFKLLIEAGFPNNLLLNKHRCGNHTWNVLDYLIENCQLMIVDYLVSDEKRREEFSKSCNREKYEKYFKHRPGKKTQSTNREINKYVHKF